MTERTIKAMAKELAGVFYEDNRSPAFRATFPTVKSYMRGIWHNPDGSVTPKAPGWMHHIKQARDLLTKMLAMPDAKVSPEMKKRIYDAILEEHEKATAPTAKDHLQRMENNGQKVH